MIAATLIAASMCLQGGEQVDVSRYVAPTASVLQLKVSLRPASGTVVVYSPGYEDQQARFTKEEAFGWIAFAEPILSRWFCRSGGPRTDGLGYFLSHP